MTPKVNALRLPGFCVDCGQQCKRRSSQAEPRCRACYLTDIKSRPRTVARGLCIDCGITTASPHTKRCRPCSAIARRGPRTQSGGYVRILCPGHPLAGADGYVLEHRLVVYEAGIEVPPGYHVHHRNAVKHDNRLENLEVLAAGDHLRHHVRLAGSVVNQYGTWPVRDAYKREEAA